MKSALLLTLSTFLLSHFGFAQQIRLGLSQGVGFSTRTFSKPVDQTGRDHRIARSQGAWTTQLNVEALWPLGNNNELVLGLMASYDRLNYYHPLESHRYSYLLEAVQFNQVYNTSSLELGINQRIKDYLSVGISYHIGYSVASNPSNMFSNEGNQRDFIDYTYDFEISNKSGLSHRVELSPQVKLSNKLWMNMSVAFWAPPGGSHYSIISDETIYNRNSDTGAVEITTSGYHNENNKIDRQYLVFRLGVSRKLWSAD